MESPTNLLSKIADNRHYAPLLWCIMLLLPIGVLIWGENGNDELSLNDRILSFDAKWKMQTALYVIHLTAVVLSCALLLRLNNTYNLMQQRTWLPATLLLFFNSCVPAFAHTLNVGILLSPILILLLYLLYGTYQSQGQQAAYGIGLLVASGGLIWPAFAFLLIPFAAGLAYMQTFTWRSATALTLGALTPAWLFFCICIVFDLAPTFPTESFFLPIAVENIADIKNTGFLVAATIIGICCGVSDSYLMTRHKIQIWRSNRFLLLLFALLILLCTINLRFLDSYLPLLHVIMAQSAGYYLIHTRNRYVLWQMGIVAIVYLCRYAWNF